MLNPKQKSVLEYIFFCCVSVLALTLSLKYLVPFLVGGIAPSLTGVIRFTGGFRAALVGGVILCANRLAILALRSYTSLAQKPDNPFISIAITESFLLVGMAWILPNYLTVPNLPVAMAGSLVLSGIFILSIAGTFYMLQFVKNMSSGK